MSSSRSDWEPPSPEELQAMLPQYEISDIIGRGGMGAVYKGRQAKLNRPVAIKLLPETYTKGEDELNFARRFEQEAQAMANLNHPAILSVYDYGETNSGQLYFVMEFADGMDVHQYLHHHGGKLAQESALTITAHVLDALDYAHSHGIAHRDIKPANILLNQEGRVKIADFGLARKFGEHADVSSPALTLANVAFGTPDFVAPEALDSDQIPDHRADLYAVGVMLYQMLTGKLPRGNFQRPSELDAEIDERLDDIVNKAMQAHPDHRYQSAAAVRSDLDSVLSQPLARVKAGEASGKVAAAVPVTTSVRGGKTGSKLPVVLGIGVAAVLVVGLIVMATKKNSTAILPVSSMEKIAEPEQTPIAGNPGVAPVENIGKMPMPQEEKSSIGILPMPSAEKTAEQEQTPVAGKPDVAPAENTGQRLEPKEEESATPVVAAAPVLAAAPVPTENTGKMPMPLSQAPPPTSPPAENPLAAIPGMKPRLDAYHTAHRTQLADLAGKYLGGLEARFDQAADAGDLKLATAYGDEKARVEALQKALAAPPADPVMAVGDESIRTLPALPEGPPEALAALRQTWTVESAKIHADLDDKLGQSLEALETELTRARDFESAKSVLAWREALGDESAGVPPADLASAAEAGGTPVLQPDLASATKDAPFENSLGMKFVPVRGTDVLFCIHETRWRDYEEYAMKTKESVEGSWKMQTNQGFRIKTDGKNHPVTHMNWDDAQAFCRWLSEKEGRTYRLPTDREWSLAVGIGRGENWKRDTTPATVFMVPDEFPWGDEWPPPKGAGNYSDESRRTTIPQDDAKYVEGGYDDGIPTTAPVMSFEANTLGLFDLGGNVWEWCEDWSSDEQEDRVLRGASWHNYNRESMLSSYRGHRPPDGRSGNGGFRIVVETGSPALAAAKPTPHPVAPAANSTSFPDPDLARASKDAPFENSLGMKFVPVPGTDVLFCIHETRYRDYEEYAKKAQESVNGSWKIQTIDGFEIKRDAEDHPVTKMSWDDAQAFCRWLSEKEGKTYRLPTDREWSIAVGIGQEEDWKADTTPATVFRVPDAFPWGKEWPPPIDAGNYSDESRRAKAPRDDTKYLDSYDDGHPTTAPVMSFAANEDGLHDLGGNVWEWCEDWSSDEQKQRVLRGASWNFHERGTLLSSHRLRSTPDLRHISGGFRLVLPVSASGR